MGQKCILEPLFSEIQANIEVHILKFWALFNKGPDSFWTELYSELIPNGGLELVFLKFIYSEKATRI